MHGFQKSQNLLLADLPAADFELLRPHLRTIVLPRGLTLAQSGEIATCAFFPHSGVISSTLATGGREAVEVRMTGRDGALGATAEAGRRRWFASAVVSVDGQSSMIDLSDLQVAIDQSVTLRAALARNEAIQQAISDQSVACRSIHDLESRLAWRLMRLCSTLGANQPAITLEALAAMMGVQRHTVALVAHSMDQAGIIRYVRGLLEVVDRDALRARSCQCHDITKAYQYHCEADLL